MAVQGILGNQKNPMYTDERLLEQLRQWHQDYGTVPRLLDCDAGGCLKDGTRLASGMTFKKRFGTWNDALTKAGLPTRPSRGGPGAK